MVETPLWGEKMKSRMSFWPIFLMFLFIDFFIFADTRSYMIPGVEFSVIELLIWFVLVPAAATASVFILARLFMSKHFRNWSVKILTGGMQIEIDGKSEFIEWSHIKRISFASEDKKQLFWFLIKLQDKITRSRLIMIETDHTQPELSKPPVFGKIDKDPFLTISDTEGFLSALRQLGKSNLVTGNHSLT